MLEKVSWKSVKLASKIKSGKKKKKEKKLCKKTYVIINEEKMIGKVSICQGTIWKGSLWFMGTFNVLRENKKTERDS